VSETSLLGRAAQGLEGLAGRAPGNGIAKLLDEDVAFLRRLDARFKGRSTAPARPPRTSHEPRGAKNVKTALIALGAAFAIGLAVAKLLEWRAFVELGKTE
jgi:hypothetical protein